MKCGMAAADKLELHLKLNYETRKCKMQMQIPDKAKAATAATEAEAATEAGNRSSVSVWQVALFIRLNAWLSALLPSVCVCVRVCATWRMSYMHECQLDVSIMSIMHYNSGTSRRHLVK